MINIICEYTEWLEMNKKNGNHEKHSGYLLKMIHEDGIIETKWRFPLKNEKDDWHAIKRYGGKFSGHTGDGLAYFVFKSQEAGQIFIDKWLIPNLLPRLINDNISISTGQREI